MLTLPNHLGIAGNELCIETRSAADLVAEHGSPLFVFSARRISENARTFRDAAIAANPRARIFYASKACSNLHVLRLIRAEGLGVEVNSGGELWKALAAGFAPQDIIFNGVAKTAEEIRSALKVGLFAINVDSAFELARIAEEAAKLATSISVILRLVPGVAGGATAGNMTGSATGKFGMTAPELTEALAIARANPTTLDLAGIHIHIGSQVNDVQAYKEGLAFVNRARAEITAVTGRPLRLLNLGGGYPIDYLHRPTGDNSQEDAILTSYGTPQTAAQMVGQVAAQAAQDFGDVTVMFEPGRSIVANAGLLITRIESQRRRGDEPWLYLDAGYNLLMDSTGGAWYFRMLNASRMAAPEEQAFRVVGPLCDSADCYYDVEGSHIWQMLQDQLSDLPPERLDALRTKIMRVPETRALPKSTQAGDLIALLDTGAYTLQEMFQYCGRLRAKAIMLDRDGTTTVLRDRDTLQDLLTPAEHSVADFTAAGLAV